MYIYSYTNGRKCLWLDLPNTRLTVTAISLTKTRPCRAPSHRSRSSVHPTHAEASSSTSSNPFWARTGIGLSLYPRHCGKFRQQQTSLGGLVRGPELQGHNSCHSNVDLDLFQQPISVHLDQSKTNPGTGLREIDVILATREKSRVLLKTGTDLGNAEGSAYGNLLWRNVFGGAETLNLNASLGTRTRSAYQAAFETPLFCDPDFRLEIGGIASSTQKSWASHDEVLKGGWSKLRWLSQSGHRHEFGYNGFWRQTTGLAENASPTVRADAGDSVKSSVFHSWINDQRDHPMLPSRGYYAKVFNEVAGWGPLKGDVSFWKSEIETQGAIPIPIPGIKGDSGISLTTGFRAGLLCPLGLDSDSRPHLSRINDRFLLGGPTDVRGFRLCGLGPREGPDALGGDVYAAGSANLLFPLPRVGAEKPIRMQAFLNGGRLLPLRTSQKNSPTNSGEVNDAMVSTISELQNGLPSIAAGVGIVYAHPVARFELNFSLPLVLRKGEEGRKGLQLGIGINFL